MLSAVLVGGSGTLLVLYLMAHRWDLPGGWVMVGVVVSVGVGHRRSLLGRLHP